MDPLPFDYKKQDPLVWQYNIYIRPLIKVDVLGGKSGEMSWLI